MARRPRTRTEWTEGEIGVLVEMVGAYGTTRWEKVSREMEAAHFVRSAKKCADKWRAIKKKVTQDQLPERAAVAEGEEPPKKKKQTGGESEEEDGESKGEDEID